MLVASLAAGALAWQPPPTRLPIYEVVNDERPRGELVFTVDLPPGVRGEELQLRDEDGLVVPVQVLLDRRISFVLPGLASRERRRLTLEPALDRRPRAIVEALRYADRVDILVDQRHALVYRGDDSLGPAPNAPPRRLHRGGYLHPVLTPQGRIVTDDYPPDAPQQHGIWTAWAKTTFERRHPDFWNMGIGTGAVQFESVLETWSGTVQAGLRARHRFVDLGTSPPTTALTDDWDVRVYALGRGKPAYRVIDLVSRQDTPTSSPVSLTESAYGGIGLRGNRAWAGPSSRTQFLTSDGRTRADGRGARARWCYMGGLVGGRPAGIAMFDHPQNARHPQPLVIHPTAPFLGYAPVALGALTIAPDRPYVARYRFIALDGPADAALLERLWVDFANPPSIALVR